MTAALLMFGYAAAVASLPAAPLARLTAHGVNARLGLAAWLVAMSSALIAMTVAVAFLVTDAIDIWPSFTRTGIPVHGYRNSPADDGGRA